MKTLLPATLAATAMLLASVPADATPRNGRGNGAWTASGFCPPGLSKRDPACVPPGQAWGGDVHRVQDLRDSGPEDILREIIRHADAEDDEDRDKAQALAIIGTLMGLALLEQNARGRGAEAAPPPAEPDPEPGPSYFSFSEVPSRPASIEALAAAQQTFGDIAPQPFGDAADPDFALAAPPPATVQLPTEERGAPSASSTPPGRIVPLGEPLPGPVPTPQEEALLSEVFRRAADEGSTGY